MSSIIKSIDCSELNSRIYSLIKNGLGKFNDSIYDVSLRKIDDKCVTIHGCKIDLSTVIHNSYTSDKLIRDYQDIESSKIPLNSLSILFLFNTLYKYLIVKDPGLVDVNIGIQLSNKSPDIILLLSLCYWIKRCQTLIEKYNFNIKYNELKDSFQTQSLTHTIQQVSGSVNVLKDTSLAIEKREKKIQPLIKQIQNLLKRIISFLSEFMICSLIKERNFNVEFISSNNQIKRCDLIVDSYNVEIKSFIDDFRYGAKVEESLEYELLGTLRRKKVKDHLNDSLLKENLNFVILHVVSTSLGMGIAKYKRNETKFEDTLNKVIEFANENNLGKSLFLPVVIFSYFINDIESQFLISTCFVKYPLKHNGERYEADDKKLSMNSINI